VTFLEVITLKRVTGMVEIAVQILALLRISTSAAYGLHTSAWILGPNAMLTKARPGAKLFKVVSRSGSPSVLQPVPPMISAGQSRVGAVVLAASVSRSESTKAGVQKTSVPLIFVHVLGVRETHVLTVKLCA